jgi:hypothetical protein
VGLTAAELRPYLERLAHERRTATYQDVARALAVEPPQTIHQVTQALEATMAEDAAAGRPLLGATVVSRTREGLPAPGFFARAGDLGRYDGPERGAEAADFHARELEAVFAWADGSAGG